MPTFGEVLKQLREKAGLSQRDLAEKAGTSQRAISFWEMGKREPALSNLQKLCTALGVGCEVFFEAEGPAEVPPAKKPAPKKRGKSQ